MGGLAGVTIFGGSALLYVSRDPTLVEWGVVKLATRAFNAAESFDERLAIYLGLPEPDVPIASLEAEILEMISMLWEQASSASSGSPPVSSSVGLTWARHVSESFSKLDSSLLLSTKSQFREKLLGEILRSSSTTPIEKQLLQIRKVFPPSVERNVFVDQLIDSYAPSSSSNNTASSFQIPGVDADGTTIIPAGWFSREVLESSPPAQQAVPCEVSTNLIRTAVTFFPGATNKLVLMLRGRMTCKEVALVLTASGGSGNNNNNVAEVESALQNLQARFEALSPPLQSYVLQQGVTATIRYLPLLGGPAMVAVEASSAQPAASSPLITSSSDKDLLASTGSLEAPPLRPMELYVHALDSDLLGPLRRDANIPASVLSQVKAVFLALPPHIQARILLAAIEHPHAQGDATPEQKAEVVRDLLSAGGIVAVKLAQMIAEDPRVPQHYRTLLGDLRDNNEPMGLVEMWHRLPGTVRERVAYLGRCLGTGSVKQVNMAILESEKTPPLLLSSSSKEDTNKNSKLVAVAVLRRGVEEEALASLSALEASKDMQPVTKKLGRMVYGEFDLFQEGEALQDFSQTSIASSPRFRVVAVEHHSPKCLIEEIGKGKTVASALSGVGKDWKRESEAPGADPIIALTMETLVEFHRAVLNAFTNDGLIHR
jgi:hypothetical protein